MLTRMDSPRARPSVGQIQQYDRPFPSIEAGERNLMERRYVRQSTQILQMDGPDCENYFRIRCCVPGVNRVLGVYHRCENVAMGCWGTILTLV
jgi:hypothetical protein